MTLTEAVEVIVKGGVVRRPTVHIERYGQQPVIGRNPDEENDNQLWISVINVDGIWPQYVYSLTVEDLTATDWEVVCQRERILELLTLMDL